MKDKIGIAASIFTVVGVIYAAVTFHHGVSYSISKDTYQYLTSHLADNYPAIELIVDKDAPSQEELNSAANETVRFLLEAYSCIEVGACSRVSTLEFVCSTRKLSNALSLSSGMVYAVSELLPAIQALEDGNDEATPTAIQNTVKQMEPHFRAVSIFGALYQSRDDSAPSVVDVPEICEDVMNPGFLKNLRRTIFFG